MQLPYHFGRYVLTRKLAVGGMAEIYCARYQGCDGFEKTVAVKKLLSAWSENKNFIAMLVDEAKALVHLQHPNIVQVIELGKEAESYFLSMELVEGLDLGRFFLRMIRDNIALPTKFSIYIICQILVALEFAHRKSLNIVHRDISPPNVLLSWNGEVKVADFGIAKGAHRTYETALTEAKGKFSYMSPEQARGEKVDNRTDLYATGILLYELITRSRLYEAPNDLEIIELVKKNAVPTEFLKETDVELRNIIFRSLEKDKGLRYQTAAEFLADINNYANGHGYITNAFEFGQFLRQTFSKEIESDKKEQIIAEEAYKKTLAFENIHQKNLGRWAGFSAALLSLVFLSSNLPNPTEKINAPPSLLPASNSPVSNENKISEDFATINIQAKPWALATIDGYAQNRETPVKNLKIKTGSHLVKVYHDPSKLWLTEKIEAKKGKTITCTAEFNDNPNLRCK